MPDRLHSLVTRRESLQLELAAAETALRRVVTDSLAKAGGEEDSAIERARTSCRRIRLEFNQLDRLVNDTLPTAQVEALLLQIRARASQ
jgi:hypothetical protein